MSFYQERILPHLIQMSMKQTHFEPYRRRVTGAARGRVLEIGIGSGPTTQANVLQLDRLPGRCGDTS